MGAFETSSKQSIDATPKWKKVNAGSRLAAANKDNVWYEITDTVWIFYTYRLLSPGFTYLELMVYAASFQRNSFFKLRRSVALSISTYSMPAISLKS